MGERSARETPHERFYQAVHRLISACYGTSLSGRQPPVIVLLLAPVTGGAIGVTGGGFPSASVFLLSVPRPMKLQRV